jgi:hypothetical protein
MKVRILAIVAMMALIGILYAMSALAAADKVTICHRPPGNPANANTLSVGSSAVPAHLGHGDSIGGCPVSPAR